MPFQPPRSLLALDTSEPLPVYSPRQSAASDQDASSIRSSAPSYVSAAPSYHSSAPPSHARAGDGSPAPNTAQPPCSSHPPRTRNQNQSQSQSQGLRPAPQYAAGFGYRPGSTLGAGPSSSSTPADPLSNPSSLRSLYNVSEWVPATEGLQSRHYHNVAKRRVSEALNASNSSRYGCPFSFPPLPEMDGAVIETDPENITGRRHTVPNVSDGRTNVLERNIHTYSSIDVVEEPHGEGAAHTRPLSPGQTMGSSRRRELERVELAQTLPLSPHEDPDLVGEEAAARFRSQRLYRTYQQHENQSHESQSSLLSQDASRHQLPQLHRPHQYTSLIPPPGQTTFMDQQRQISDSPPSAAASPSPPNDRSATPNATRTEFSDQDQMAPVCRRRAATTTEFEEALREQESRNWDFLLAQMATWEEREREWKRFKDYLDKRKSSRGGMGWVFANSLGGPAGGNRDGTKLKKTSKKWKNKVHLAT